MRNSVEYHRHEEIKNLIVNTAALRTEVDNLLRSEHADILNKLDEVLLRLDEFRGLALALCISQGESVVAIKEALSEDARTLLKEASHSRDGFVWKSETSMYGELININIKDQEFLGKPGDNRAQARWLHAFDELVRAGCFEPTSHQGGFRVSHIGYQLADQLKQQT
ncbi:MAG: hypothetical protein ABSF95_14060 [Verrucomicrobiota bacterium]|jgi:hypothetical protein